MDTKKMAQGVRAFLDGLELDAASERFAGDELERTPDRVARAWRDDLAGGYRIDPAGELTWIQAPPNKGPVLVGGISFASVCVHHLLPFFGVAHVAYLPGERLAGLSKIGRVIDALARRLQTQERLTSQIVSVIDDVLQPQGVVALLEAEHTCMTLRGVRKESSRMTTLSSAGIYDRDREARREIVDLLARHRRVDS